METNESGKEWHASYSGLLKSEGYPYPFPNENLSAEQKLSKKWKLYDPDSADDVASWGGRINCSDMQVLTVDGDEVIASSEQLCADRDVLLHIVELHNAHVDSSNP